MYEFVFYGDIKILVLYRMWICIRESVYREGMNLILRFLKDDNYSIEIFNRYFKGYLCFV